MMHCSRNSMHMLITKTSWSFRIKQGLTPCKWPGTSSIALVGKYYRTLHIPQTSCSLIMTLFYPWTVICTTKNVETKRHWKWSWTIFRLQKLCFIGAAFINLLGKDYWPWWWLFFGIKSVLIFYECSNFTLENCTSVFDHLIDVI
jgi:hypothetical protein